MKKGISKKNVLNHIIVSVISTRAVIGQFSGPYSPARTAKIKVFFVAKLLRDLHRQIFSTYIANKSLKLSFTLNCVLKRANDLKMISN